MDAKESIVVQAVIKAPIDKVWKLWTGPEHIIKWNAASDDWHTTQAKNDLQKGGRFWCRMEAKDGSNGFEFGGKYDEIKNNESIAYTIDDKRKVKVSFSKNNDVETKMIESFEAETANPVEMQRSGWQAILNNFKKYAEAYI